MVTKSPRRRPTSRPASRPSHSMSSYTTLPPKPIFTFSAPFPKPLSSPTAQRTPPSTNFETFFANLQIVTDRTKIEQTKHTMSPEEASSPDDETTASSQEPSSSPDRDGSSGSSTEDLEAPFLARIAARKAIIRQKAATQRALLAKTGKSDAQSTSETRAAPLFSQTALEQTLGSAIDFQDGLYPQYGLLGGIITDGDNQAEPELLQYNVAVPSSAFICGRQGSGKSHTLSCLLENCLVASDANRLPRALTGLLLHYDTFVNDDCGTPCEAAYLASDSSIKVRVLCAPTNIATMKRTYAKLPNVSVEVLQIDESNLTTQRMMNLMAVQVEGSMPLYLHVLNRILRDLRCEQQAAGTSFDYRKFTGMLAMEAMTDAQKAPLRQRLDTLESFMPKSQTQPRLSRKTATTRGNDWTPTPGQLTIVDLSCPCVTADTACLLFGICLSLFIEQQTQTNSGIGRVVALDEAHKYMTESAEAGSLTESLLQVIRLQRHLGTRVMISTQEPTISPKLLGLCDVTVVHRFSSPDWLKSLEAHLAGVKLASRGSSAKEPDSGGGADIEGREVGEQEHGATDLPLRLKGQDPAVELFREIVHLRVGEALVLAPSALLGLCASTTRPEKKLECGVLKIKVRGRVTEDGGKTKVAN